MTPDFDAAERQLLDELKTLLASGRSYMRIGQEVMLRIEGLMLRSAGRHPIPGLTTPAEARRGRPADPNASEAGATTTSGRLDGSPKGATPE